MDASEKIRVGIVGVTGYAGMEALKYLLHHPLLTVTYVASREGRKVEPLEMAIPQFAGITKLEIVPYDEAMCSDACDVVLVALPHGVSGTVSANLADRGKRVIDLSGDLRIPSDLYQQWYQRIPVGNDVVFSAVYGLSEWNREEIVEANLIANPGCYATAALLALKPIVDAGYVAANTPIIVDAKSGVSGAGKSPQGYTQFAELTENFYAYKPGTHQHVPEIEYVLNPNLTTRILFTPHLLPISRGIFASSYISLSGGADLSIHDISQIYRNRYEHEPFVQMRDVGVIPETKWVRGTNQCQLSLRLDDRTGILQVFSVIDNLGKGAAGQAVQNLNIMHGFPETTGLMPNVAWAP